MDTNQETTVDPVFKLKLPMRIKTSSKKKQALNLNVYRNLHFRSLDAQKKMFYKIAKKLLRGIPPLGVITLHYEVFPQTKRRLDIMNVGSIIDKYFSDSLTECGIIEDDDYTHIPQVSFAFGGLVKSEHLLVTITEIEPRKEAMPMRVLLDNDDIQRALTTYVSTLNIPNASGVRLISDDGVITAEVLFDLDPDASEVSEEKPKRRRGGRPAGSKNKPKETANVDETVSTGATGSSEGTDPASADEATPATETEADEVATPKGKSRKNLFGDKESPSSEDDGEAEEATPDTPEPVAKETGAKKGSIFDS